MKYYEITLHVVSFIHFCVICGTTIPGGRFNKFTMRNDDLLCTNCDKVLKLAGNDIQTLESMIEYLHKNK